MSVDGPRTSVFTFQSAVHSHHVLRSLEELRQKELLCDVTVEVERRSFRAHSSVLASSSHYFYTRLTNHSRPNLTVILPDEVMLDMVDGWVEPGGFQKPMVKLSSLYDLLLFLTETHSHKHTHCIVIYNIDQSIL